MSIQYTEWIRRWQSALDACQRKGGETSELVIMPPATPRAVAEIEAALGQPLPQSFKRVLLEFSAEVNFNWYLDDVGLPQPYRGLFKIFAGECSWSLPRMNEIISGYQGWLEVFNVDDPDEWVWFGKLPFVAVVNGDNIAFDVKYTPDAPVIYLSHEIEDWHGYRLGHNFIDFIERASLLGHPGYEGWQMMAFLPDATSGLDAYGENARKWQEWFGLDFEV